MKSFLISMLISLSTISAIAQNGQPLPEVPSMVTSDQLSRLIRGVFTGQMNDVLSALKTYVPAASNDKFRVESKHQNESLKAIYFYDKETGRVANVIEFAYGETDVLRGVPVAIAINGRIVDLKDNWNRMIDSIVEAKIFETIQGSLDLGASEADQIEDSHFTKNKLLQLLRPQIELINDEINQGIEKYFEVPFNPSEIAANTLNQSRRKDEMSYYKRRTTRYLMNIVGGLSLLGATISVGNNFHEVANMNFTFRGMGMSLVQLIVAVANLVPLFDYGVTHLHSTVSEWKSYVKSRLAEMKRLSDLKKIGRYRGEIKLRQKIGAVEIQAVQANVEEIPADGIVVPSSSKSNNNLWQVGKKIQIAGQESTAMRFEALAKDERSTINSGDSVLLDATVHHLTKVHAFLALWGTSDFGFDGSYISGRTRDLEIATYRKALTSALTQLAKRADLRTIIIPVTTHTSYVGGVLASQIIFDVLQDLASVLEKGTIRKVILQSSDKFQFEAARAAIRTHFYDKPNQASDIMMGRAGVGSCMMLFN